MTTQPSAPNDMELVAMHADAALRRRRDALDGLASDDIATSSSRQLAAVADAMHAVLSLYLAASAAERICETNGEPGPLGRDRLDDLVRVTRYARDAVMHWEDKGRRDPSTWIGATTWGVLVNAPDGRMELDAFESGIEWRTFEKYATRLHRWAAWRFDPDVEVVDSIDAPAPRDRDNPA